MKRLDWFNLAGVLCLGGLCLFQWAQNRALNQEVNRQIEAAGSLSNRLDEQTRMLDGVQADLAEFQRKYANTESAATAAAVRVRPMEARLRELTGENARLQVALSNWTAAVTARDGRIRSANAEIQRLDEVAIGSSRRYEALATNYNAVVGELNRLRTNGSVR